MQIRSIRCGFVTFVCSNLTDFLSFECHRKVFGKFCWNFSVLLLFSKLLLIKLIWRLYTATKSHGMSFCPLRFKRFFFFLLSFNRQFCFISNDVSTTSWFGLIAAENKSLALFVKARKLHSRQIHKHILCSTLCMCLYCITNVNQCFVTFFSYRTNTRKRRKRVRERGKERESEAVRASLIEYCKNVLLYL